MMMHLELNRYWTMCGVFSGWWENWKREEEQRMTMDLEAVTCLACLEAKAQREAIVEEVKKRNSAPKVPIAVLPRARYFMPSVLVLYYPPGCEEEADRILGLLKAGEPVRLPSDRYHALEGGEQRWRLEVVGGGELGGQEVKTQKTPLFPYAVCPECGTATNVAYKDGPNHLCYYCKNVFP